MFWVIVLFVYFLPTIVANTRKHKNENAIFIINLFLGLTAIGWVIALAWSVTDNTKGKNNV